MKHPDIRVKLIGRDGNAFAIIGHVSKALRRAGHEEDAAAFMKEASSGDYNHLLVTAMSFVSCY